MITRILETILYCRDLDGARRFYADILGLRPVSDMRPRSLGFRVSADHVLLLFNPDDFTDAHAIATIERITRGNFRLVERLFPQIERVLKINELDTITNDVIEAAASTLVIGVS